MVISNTVKVESGAAKFTPKVYSSLRSRTVTEKTPSTWMQRTPSGGYEPIPQGGMSKLPPEPTFQERAARQSIEPALRKPSLQEQTMKAKAVRVESPSQPVKQSVPVMSVEPLMTKDSAYGTARGVAEVVDLAKVRSPLGRRMDYTKLRAEAGSTQWWPEGQFVTLSKQYAFQQKALKGIGEGPVTVTRRQAEVSSGGLKGTKSDLVGVKVLSKGEEEFIEDYGPKVKREEGLTSGGPLGFASKVVSGVKEFEREKTSKAPVLGGASEKLGNLIWKGEAVTDFLVKKSGESVLGKVFLRDPATKAGVLTGVLKFGKGFVDAPVTTGIEIGATGIVFKYARFGKLADTALFGGFAGGTAVGGGLTAMGAGRPFR